MFETYLGLLPGEAPIDRLIDGAVADPALTARADSPLVIGDATSGAVLALIAREPARAATAAPSLWQRLRVRWMAGEAAHV